jgi:hypothetical protein
MASDLPLAAASARLRGRPGRPRTRPVSHGPRHGARQVPVQTGPVERPQNPQSVERGRLLGLKGAASYLAVSDWTLRKLMAQSQLAPVRLPGVCRLLFDRTDLDRLIERSRLP